MEQEEVFEWIIKRIAIIEEEEIETIIYNVSFGVYDELIASIVKGYYE
jgi:hypothetical protein